MQIEQIEIDTVRYNPEREAFETLVRIHDGDQSFSYPAHVYAPLNAEFSFVTRALTQFARSAHKRAKPVLRMQHGVSDDTCGITPRQKSLLDRLLGEIAA